jgi:hypothetical protein
MPYVKTEGMKRPLLPGLIRSPRGDQWEPASLARVPVCPHSPFVTWPMTTCAQQALGTTHVSLPPPSRQALPAGRSINAGQMPSINRTENCFRRKRSASAAIPEMLSSRPPIRWDPWTAATWVQSSTTLRNAWRGPLVCVIPAGHALKPTYQARCSPKISFPFVREVCVWERERE